MKPVANMLASFFAALGLGILLALPLEIYPAVENLHDLQRAGQILIFFVAGLAGISILRNGSPIAMRREVWGALVVVLALGVVSSIVSKKPFWAFVEVSVFVSCLLVFFISSIICARNPEKYKYVLHCAVVFSCSWIVLKFFILYTFVFISGLGAVDPWFLLSGFDNIRFFAQFSIIMMPLLALPLLMGASRRWIFWFLLSMWWCLLIFSGTRGGWIAIALVAFIFFLLGSGARKWAIIQGKSALSGLLMFWILTGPIPLICGMQVTNHAVDRLNASSSGRVDLWSQAVDAWWKNPLMGLGPMHLANTNQGRAAHPHQLFLQWAAEWGSISLIILLCIIGYALHEMFKQIRQRGEDGKGEELYVCVSASILAALILGMVDGIFVMPVSQIWFSVLLGWLFAEHARYSRTNHSVPISKSMALSFLVLFGAPIIFLLLVLIRDGSNHGDRQQMQHSMSEPIQPRFWLRGRIERR